MTVLFTDGREMPLSEGLAAIRREYPDAAAYDQLGWDVDLERIESDADLEELLDPLGIDTVLVWADEAASLDDPGGNSIAKITTNEEEAKP
tara:strand:- start:861 stop:1133 length:273 start_codon:yes stop_codon:yes gene_type:complete